MTKSFLYVSLLFVCGLFVSCARHTYPLVTEGNAIIKVDDKLLKYNLQIDFGVKRFDGILALRRMDSGEIRILGSTQFGLSLFDFGLDGNNWRVYDCLEPMRKERVLKLFEKDFKALFLSGGVISRVGMRAEYAKYVNGSGITKGVIKAYPGDGQNPDSVSVKHSWLRLSMRLNKIEDEDVAR